MFFSLKWQALGAVVDESPQELCQVVDISEARDDHITLHKT